MSRAKLCVFCSRLTEEYQFGSYYMECLAGHFESFGTLGGLREIIHTAKRCPDFTTEFVERPTMTVAGTPLIGWLKDR